MSVFSYLLFFGWGGSSHIERIFPGNSMNSANMEMDYTDRNTVNFLR
jgi:hypothetical protein